MSNLKHYFQNFQNNITVQEINDELCINFPFSITKLDCQMPIYVHEEDGNLIFSDRGELIHFLIDENEFEENQVLSALQNAQNYFNFEVDNDVIMTECHPTNFNEMLNYFMSILNFLGIILN